MQRNPLHAWLLAFVLLTAAGCATSVETASDAPSATAVPPDTSFQPVPRAIPAIGERTPTAVTDSRLDTVEAGRFDDGRMWTFGYPPLDYFEEEYGFRPDDEWLRHARLAALRFADYCSASFVSPHGLVLTNHHCARASLTKVGRPGEDLLETGFYAETLADEREVPGLYVDQLIAIEKVTDEVEAALAAAQTDAERAEARREVFEDIKARLDAAYGPEDVHVQVVPLYHGALYSAYVYRRYDDVRLVMAPSKDLGFFGGSPDNFTYPRFALDMAFFRVYGEDGEPLQSEYYFPFDTTGSRPGAAVFVVGNPGSTLRLSTVAQLEYRRDVSDKALERFLETRVAALEAYAAAHPGREPSIQNTIFGLKNALKLYRGRLRGVNDPYIMARLREAEEEFVQAIQEDPALRERYGGLIDSLAAIQQQKRAYADAYGAFLILQSPSYSSATLRRALLAYRLLRRRQQGASGDALADLREQLRSVAPQPDALDRRLLAARLTDFQYYFGEESALVQRVLDGRSPEEAARFIVQNSVLSDYVRAARALRAGGLSMDDPALRLVNAFYERYRTFQSAMAGLRARQREIARRLGQARFAVYGTSVPPDATFTLRIADGRVRGYEYNGTRAAAYTSFFGLYDHYFSYGADTHQSELTRSWPGDSPWDLPERWLTPPDGFNRAASLNLVSTNDITGGNSGSPLLNKDLEVVGLVFDGNIQSLASDFIFLPQRRMRAISVDVRGMLEALDDIYRADRLVLELTEGVLVETEAAAD